MGGGRSQGSGEIGGKPGGLGSTDRLRFGGNIRGKDEKPLLREDSVPFPASVSPCVEMKGHPLSRGLRWHQLPLNNLQVIPGGDGNHPGPADGRIRGLQMWGQEFLWMWGCWHPCGWGDTGLCRRGAGGWGALCMGGSAEKSDRGSAYGGTGVPDDEGTQSFEDEGRDRVLSRTGGQGCLKVGGNMGL